MAEVRMMTYPFSVREDVVAELRLPVDLTPKEAERLAQFIAAIALDRAAGEAGK